LEGTIAGLTHTVLNVMSLLLVGAGLVLLSTFFVGSPLPGSAITAEAVANEEPATPVLGKEVGSKNSEGRVGGIQRGKEAAAKRQEDRPKAIDVPEDKRLRITVPAMSRIRDRVVPYATATDEDAFRDYAAVHLRGTGNPWNREANVYIAGHRLGYVGTPSFLAFWDLNKVDVGDKIYVTDSTGKRYVYTVFKDFIVDPTDLHVLRPLKGKNIVTLQTCTLPDYSRRLIIQAERVTWKVSTGFAGDGRA
jgi:sortase A